MAKTSTKKRIKNLMEVITTWVVVTILLFPFFVLLMRSFMSEDEIYNYPKLFPETLQFQNYYNAEFFESFLQWGGNTLLIAACCIVGTVSSAFLCAYGFSKVHFKGKKLFFAVTMASTMLPGVTLRIPLYLMFSEWGWLDGSLLPLIAPAFFGGGALNIFLIMQFIKGIPNSMFESAHIDGANKFKCLTNIALPICKPIVVYLCVTTFIGVWNDYSSALTYLSNSPESWTLALGLYKTSLDPLFRENQQMAMGALMCIPPLVIFGFSQKTLIEGVSISGIKA